MTTLTDKGLKSAIAEAAKAGALARVAELLQGEYAIEVITDDPLLMQIRIKKANSDGTLTSGAPRYFTFKVAEPI